MENLLRNVLGELEIESSQIHCQEKASGKAHSDSAQSGDVYPPAKLLEVENRGKQLMISKVPFKCLDYM